MRDPRTPVSRAFAFALAALLTACGGSDDIDQQPQQDPPPIFSPPSCPTTGVCR